MFTTAHFIWIAICIVFVILMMFLSKKFNFSLQIASYILSTICIASELCKIFTHMEEGKYGGMVLDPGALPFHLCSILIFVVLYITFTKNETHKKILLSFFTPISIIGGTLAILMATSGTDFAQPYAYQCFVYHAGLLWFGIYLIATKQVDLGIKAYKRNLIVLMSLLFTMIWVNSILSDYGTNFFFVVRPPASGLPILNLNHGWFVYFISFVLLGFFLLTLFHLPFMLKEQKSQKN